MERIRGLLAPLLVVAVVGACNPPPTSPPPSVVPSAPTSSPATSSPTVSIDPSPPSATVAWTRLTLDGDGPEARTGHSWTIDPSDAAAYLFGGEGAQGALDDVWRYDLGADAWEPRAANGPRPAPRSGHAAAFVDDVGLVVLGGTAGDGTILDDAWAYDPLADAWTELATTGDTPPARTNACAAVDPDGRIWTTHGFGDGDVALSDVWALDSAGWSWSVVEPSGTAPPGRGAHGCWWTTDGRLVVHGGRDGATVLGDTWATDGVLAETATWSSADSGGTADPRSDFGSTLASDRIVIVAGVAADGVARNDVIALAPGSLAVETFIASAGGPEPRTNTAIVDDPGNERSLLFGGAVGGSPTDELWSFDLR